MKISLAGRTLSAAVIALVLGLSLSASAQQAPVGPPPSAPDQTPPPKPVPGDNGAKDHKSEGGAPVDSNTYKVGPADVLNIKVWDEDKFTGPVTVHQDGKITLPLVGDLDAGGLTPVEIEAGVTKALAEYVKKPLVTVTVMDVQSKKYYLDGLVNHAGEYPLSVPTTVLEAISKAGGLQDFANEKKIYILRGDKKLPFNFKEVKNGKHMDQNIRLEPGDHIFVP